MAAISGSLPGRTTLLRYPSQREAYPYFILSTLLLPLMIVFGGLGAIQYVAPTFLMNTLNFSITRTVHLNLLIFWLVLGLMGATYYLVPEEAERDIWSRKLARVQFWVLALTGVAAVLNFVVLKNTEGKPFVEAPLLFDLLIVVAFLIFLFNFLMTILRGKRTAIIWILFGGLSGLALLYLIDLVYIRNLSLDYYFWWWIIHLWVEGTWEMVAAAIAAFLIIKLTHVPKGVIYRWLYVEVILVLLTGIIGTGHHYYWIGTPAYWLPIGAIFSALEPIPIALMLWEGIRHLSRQRLQPENKVSWNFSIAMVLLHFVGAGIWGFSITLPQVNKWTHGTQLTASHGHFAFYGAYGLLVLAAIYYMVPKIKNISYFSQTRAMWSFWLMNIGMVGMVLALAGAGIVQTYLWRITGMDFMTVRNEYLKFWMYLRLVFGAAVFAPGVLLYLWDFFALKPAPAPAAPSPETKAPP